MGKMKETFKAPKERNPLWDHPMLKKGGRHNKLEKQKKILRKRVREEF